MTYRIVATRHDSDRLDIIDEWEFERPATAHLRLLRRQVSRVGPKHRARYRVIYMGDAYEEWKHDPRAVAAARLKANLRVATSRLARAFHPSTQ